MCSGVQSAAFVAFVSVQQITTFSNFERCDYLYHFSGYWWNKESKMYSSYTTVGYLTQCMLVWWKIIQIPTEPPQRDLAKFWMRNGKFLTTFFGRFLLEIQPMSVPIYVLDVEDVYKLIWTYCILFCYKLVNKMGLQHIGPHCRPPPLGWYRPFAWHWWCECGMWFVPSGWPERCFYNKAFSGSRNQGEALFWIINIALHVDTSGVYKNFSAPNVWLWIFWKLCLVAQRTALSVYIRIPAAISLSSQQNPFTFSAFPTEEAIEAGEAFWSRSASLKAFEWLFQASLQFPVSTASKLSRWGGCYCPLQ